MAYEKQNFKDGLTLFASQLNHIEDGIASIENAIPKVSIKSVAQSSTGKKGVQIENVIVNEDGSISKTSGTVWDGEDGITPHIGANGNWFIGTEDTGVPAGGSVSGVNAVMYTEQDLTHEQQAQSRKNIGVLEPFGGSTADITPAQVSQAMMEGRNVVVLHNDPTYGFIYFNGFVEVPALDAIASSGVMPYGNTVMRFSLIGDKSSAFWYFDYGEIATSELTDYVKTVNGNSPDEDGNVEILGLSDISVTPVPVNGKIGGHTVKFIMTNGGFTELTVLNGKDYVLTEDDKVEIAGLVDIPSSGGNVEFDSVTGKTESTVQTIALDDAMHYGEVNSSGTIIASEVYMYTDKIKLNETKTFSLTGTYKTGVLQHIAIRRIISYDAYGNRLSEHSITTEIKGEAVSKLPTRPITMNEAVDSVVLLVYKAFDYTNKTLTLDGVESKDVFCQFAPMSVISSYDIPVLTLEGDCAGMTKNVSKNLNFTFRGMSGVAEVKLQGSSSVKTGKQIGGGFDNDVGGLYNFTIKFPQAFEAKEGWGAQTKYCFKANAIDHSHARNVCSCKLWGQIVKSRTNVPAELSSLPNGGAIDGFPIVISINGKYYALGTLNIPKDAWMFGSPKAIVCADTHCDATKFKALATLDGDFELEYVEDENNADWVLASLNTAIQAVMNSNGSDIDTTIGQYIDIPSAIDYYIHTVEESADDGTSKNYILVTFDGTKWYFSTYDRDTTYGLHWTGETIDYQKDGVNFVRYADVHKLMELIYNHKKADLKSRAVALRNDVKSELNVANVFTKFVGGIPAAIYEQNTKRWPLLRSTSISNVEQILNWYRMRRAYLDKLIDAM